MQGMTYSSPAYLAQVADGRIGVRRQENAVGLSRDDTFEIRTTETTNDDGFSQLAITNQETVQSGCGEKTQFMLTPASSLTSYRNRNVFEIAKSKEMIGLTRILVNFSPYNSPQGPALISRNPSPSQRLVADPRGGLSPS